MHYKITVGVALEVWYSPAQIGSILDSYQSLHEATESLLVKPYFLPRDMCQKTAFHAQATQVV